MTSFFFLDIDKMQLKTALFAVIGAFVFTALAQNCNTLGPDIELTGRLCLENQCLNSSDFQAVKVPGISIYAC